MMCLPETNVVVVLYFVRFLFLCLCYSYLSRFDVYDKVANHLENEYASATRSGLEDQTNHVILDSKQYLTSALVHFVNDLNIISDQFNSLLYLQEYSLDSLSTQTDLLQSRILSSKNQKLYTSLDEMQIPYKTEVSSTIGPAIREIPKNEIHLPVHLKGIALENITKK
jgi:hypothetical protein